MATFADKLRVWFGSPASKMRGQPAPLGLDERRPYPEMRFRAPMGLITRAPSREYDRSIDSWVSLAPFLDYDPIGAGVVATRKLSIHQGDYKPGEYAAGGIYWNVNPQAAATGWGNLPRLGPIYDPQTLYALLGPINAQAVAPAPPQGYPF